MEITLIFLGGLALIAIIALIANIQRRKVQHTALEDLLEKAAKATHTTPKPGDDGLRGKYKDYPIEVTGRFWIGSTRQEHESGAKVEKAQRQWATFNPHMKVVLTVPNGNLPTIALWDDLSHLPSGTILPEQRQALRPQENKVGLDTTQLSEFSHIYTEDDHAARMWHESEELKHALKNWHFIDLRAKDNTITLTLDNPLVWDKFRGRLKNPQYIIQAMDICVAGANALRG